MADIEKKLTPVGKAMGKQMVRSWQIPQFAVETEIDCEPMIAYRKSLGFKPSYTTILAKAVADTLADFPVIRSSWAEDHLVIHEDIHIGIAVDTPRGLLVPVIRDVDKKSLEEVHADMEEIKAGSAKGLYTMEQMTGGVFTISNLGIFNVDFFNAIVSSPEGAILAVSKMSEKPVVKNGQIVIGKTMRMAISSDHRMIDGATAAKFMTALAAQLESLA